MVKVISVTVSAGKNRSGSRYADHVPGDSRRWFTLPGALLAGVILLGGCSDNAPPAAESEPAAAAHGEPPDHMESPGGVERAADSAPERLVDELPEYALDTMMRQAAEAGAAGEEQRMVDMLELAIVAYPAAAEPRIALGRYYMLKQDSGSALALLEEFAPGAEETPALLGLYGAAQLAQGQYSRARETLERLRELEPDKPAVHYQLAKIYAQLGEAELVKPSLDRAIELSPENVEARVALARYQLLRGDSEAAAEEIRLLQELAPDHPDVARLVDGQQQDALIEESRDLETAIQQAQQRLAAGDMPAALSGYRAVLGLDPDNLEALNNLAWFSKEVDPAGALGYARRAAELAPEAPLVLDTLAMVLVANQQTDEAVETIQSALALAPEQPEILLHGAIIFREAGDTDRALRMLEDLANSGEDSAEKTEARRLLEELEREAAQQG